MSLFLNLASFSFGSRAVKNATISLDPGASKRLFRIYFARRPRGTILSNVAYQFSIDIYLSQYFSNFCLSADSPPKNVPIMIRELSGRMLSGMITGMHTRRDGSFVAQLSRVSILEIRGLGKGLEPIYDKKSRINGIVNVPLDKIVFWEKLPDYLKLDWSAHS